MCDSTGSKENLESYYMHPSKNGCNYRYLYMLILTNSHCLDCEVPEAPTNGHVSLPEGTYLADIALYDCDPGYTRVGPSTRMCEETGEWSGEQPDCLVIGKLAILIYSLLSMTVVFETGREKNTHTACFSAVVHQILDRFFLFSLMSLSR